MQEQILYSLTHSVVGAVNFLDFLNKFQTQAYIILGVIGIGAVIIGGVSQDFTGTIKVAASCILAAVLIAIFGNLETIATYINNNWINLGPATAPVKKIVIATVNSLRC